MLKLLFSFLFIFLFLSTFSEAKDGIDLKLKQEYGDDLSHAPFFLRFAFLKAYNKDWKESIYPERESFLKDYELNLSLEQKQEKEEAKQEAEDERERSKEKREALQRQRDRLRAEIQEEETEKQEEESRQQDFATSIAAQKRELSQMESQISQQR